MGINPVFYKSKFLAIILAGVFLLSACSGESSSSTSSSNCVGLVCIEAVNVANAGNPADADTGFGAVSDPYAIGKYEVKVGQYVVFLNAVATTTDQDAIRDLWSPDMQNLKSYISVVGLITRTGLGTSTQPYVYTEKVKTQKAPPRDHQRAGHGRSGNRFWAVCTKGYGKFLGDRAPN